jgi:hypothetical protein
MNFEELYQQVSYADKALKPLLEKLRNQLATHPKNLAELKTALISLLEFLASPQGRTDENCRAVDFFLMLDEEWNSEELPEAYAEILADMSGALHDIISAPNIAENFESTPEQLLKRAKDLNE